MVTGSKFLAEDTHCTNFCCHGDQAPKISAPLVSIAYEHEWDDADSGKLQHSAKEACACATLSNTNPTLTGTRLNLGAHSARPVTDCLNHDMA